MINLKDMAFRLPNIIPKEKSKKWIDFFETHIDQAFNESSTKYEDTVYNATDNFLALNLNENFEKGVVYQETAKDIFTYINLMILNYTQFLKSKITPVITGEHMSTTSNIRIMRYKKGQEIKDHLDIGKGNNRASCTLNLHSDYEGGEFNFFSDKYLMNLKQGEGLIFPAEQVWIHGVKPVTKGTRYCINCFLHP